MTSYAGMDVSQQETHICVVSELGKVLFEGQCFTDPKVIADVLEAKAPELAGAVMETGALAPWLTDGLKKYKIPIICVCARQAHAAIQSGPNKTDKGDAFGLARLAQTGWLKRVHVRSLSAHEVKSMILARKHLVQVKVATSNTIRGMLKPFGLLLGKVAGGKFDARVRELTENQPGLLRCAERLLATLTCVRSQIAEIDTQLIQDAKGSPACRRMMTIPSVGAQTARTFSAVIDDPTRFRRSKDLGAYLGMTPKQWQSGQVDQRGRISKCGDAMLRNLLYECAHVLLSVVKRPCALQRWGKQLEKRVGAKKARVALARKLAILMHKLWIKGEDFNWKAA